MTITMATAVVQLLVAAHIVSITVGRGKLSRLSTENLSTASAEASFIDVARRS